MLRARHLVTISSLLLALSVAMVWVRSYYVSDKVVVFLRDGRGWQIDSVGGEISLYWHLERRPGDEVYIRWYRTPLVEIPEFVSLVGFSYQRSSDDIFVTAPMWSFVLVFLLLPALRLWRTLAARRRSRQGLCRRCGYDLRASAKSCPECGTVVSADTPCQNKRRRGATM
jgi:hypothetical protein